MFYKEKIKIMGGIIKIKIKIRFHIHSWNQNILEIIFFKFIRPCILRGVSIKILTCIYNSFSYKNRKGGCRLLKCAKILYRF